MVLAGIILILDGDKFCNCIRRRISYGHRVISGMKLGMIRRRFLIVSSMFSLLLEEKN